MSAATLVSVRCRLLAPEDLEAFYHLRLRACREEPEAFLESYEELSRQSPEEVAQSLDNGWIAGAYEEHRLVGIAGLYRHLGLKLRHKGTVWGVYVAPEARGRKLAAQLITLLLSEAKAFGLERVHLSANAENPVAVNVYQKLGFAPWGVEKHIMKLANGRYVDDVAMVKELT